MLPRKGRGCSVRKVVLHTSFLSKEDAAVAFLLAGREEGGELREELVDV